MPAESLRGVDSIHVLGGHVFLKILPKAYLAFIHWYCHIAVKLGVWKHQPFIVSPSVWYIWAVLLIGAGLGWTDTDRPLSWARSCWLEAGWCWRALLGWLSSVRSQPTGSLSFFCCQWEDSKRDREHEQGLLRPELGTSMWSPLLLLAKAHHSQRNSRGGSGETPYLDGKRHKVTFQAMCRQGGVKN